MWKTTSVLRWINPSIIVRFIFRQMCAKNALCALFSVLMARSALKSVMMGVYIINNLSAKNAIMGIENKTWNNSTQKISWKYTKMWSKIRLIFNNHLLNKTFVYKEWSPIAWSITTSICAKSARLTMNWYLVNAIIIPSMSFLIASCINKEMSVWSALMGGKLIMKVNVCKITIYNKYVKTN